MAQTLRTLLDEFDGNGAVYTDAGSGSAGPRWVSIEDMDDQMLDVEMTEMDEPKVIECGIESRYESDWVHTGIRWSSTSPVIYIA